VHAVRAFELAAVDYLLKPIAGPRLSMALDRVRQQQGGAAACASAVIAALATRASPQRMAVRSGGKYVVFDPFHVSAVIVADHYATLYVDGKELLSEEPLDRLAPRLGPDFIRVHRSAALNLAFVQELVREGDRQFAASLSSPMGLRVPVSRDRLDGLKARLGLA
jgi:two-component system LytT family response regulator